MAENGSLKAAEEAAARVNAMLVATGQLRTSDIIKSKSKSVKSTDLFVEKVVINDAPLSARNYLTKSSSQEEISRTSGASVATRGRYMSKEEIENNKTTDKPLFLHIQGVNEQDVKVAVGRIMHIIMTHTHRSNDQNQNKPKNNPTNHTQHPIESSNEIQQNTSSLITENVSTEAPQIFCPKVFREKVFLPITTNVNPVEIRLRLLGEENSNLIYIKNETGASVFMRGIGSGFVEPNLGMESQEALHFYLEHTNEEKFNEAKGFIVNLAQTILAQLHQEPQPPPQPQSSQVHFAPTGPPLNSQPPIVQQQVFQSTLPIPMNGNVPPPTVHQAAPPPAANIPIQNVPPHTVITHPPPPHLTMQVNPFQVPVVVSTSQQGNAMIAQNCQLADATLQHQPTDPPPTHLVQISLASAPTASDVVTQQIVQTSATPQLLHFPSASQIVNSVDGPKVISFSPAVSSIPSNFVTHSVPSQQNNGPLGVVLTPSLPQSIPQTGPSVPVPQPVIHSLPHQIPPQAIFQPAPQVVPQHQNVVPVQSEILEQRRDNVFPNSSHVHFQFPPQSTSVPNVTATSIYIPNDSPTCPTFVNKDMHATQPQFPFNPQQRLDTIQNSGPFFSNAVKTTNEVCETIKAGSEWNIVNKSLSEFNQEKTQSITNPNYNQQLQQQQDTSLQFSELDRTSNHNLTNVDQKPVMNDSLSLPWAQYSQTSIDTSLSSEVHSAVNVQGPPGNSSATCLLNDGGNSMTAKVASFVSEHSSNSGVASIQGAPRQGSSNSFSPKRTCASREYCLEAKRYRSFWSKGDDHLNSEDGARHSSNLKVSTSDTEVKVSGLSKEGFENPIFQGSRPPIPSNGSHLPIRNIRPNRGSSVQSFGPDRKVPPMYKSQYRESNDSWHCRNQHEGWGAAGLRPGLRENPWQRGGSRNPSVGRPFMHYDKPFTKTRFPYRQ